MCLGVWFLAMLYAGILIQTAPDVPDADGNESGLAEPAWSRAQDDISGDPETGEGKGTKGWEIASGTEVFSL